MIRSTAVTGAQLLRRFSQAASSFTRPRPVQVDMLVQFDDLPVIVRIRDGSVTEIVERGVALQSWDFAVKGTAEGWSQFW